MSGPPVDCAAEPTARLRRDARSKGRMELGAEDMETCVFAGTIKRARLCLAKIGSVEPIPGSFLVTPCV